MPCRLQSIWLRRKTFKPGYIYYPARNNADDAADSKGLRHPRFILPISLGRIATITIIIVHDAYHHRTWCLPSSYMIPIIIVHDSCIHRAWVLESSCMSPRIIVHKWNVRSWWEVRKAILSHFGIDLLFFDKFFSFFFVMSKKGVSFAHRKTINTYRETKTILSV